MNLKIFILPILILIVAISGCVGGTQPSNVSGYGAAILNFAPDVDTVYSGKTVKLSAVIENQGESVIYNKSSIVYLIGSNLVEGESTSGQWNVSSFYVYLNKDLNPADPVKGTLPGSKEIKYTVYAPTLSKGESKSDTFTLRFYYLYNTKVDTNAWVYSEAEAAALKAAGKSLELPSTKYTKGPLEVEVSYAPSSPIVSSTDNTFTMYITIKNVGGGTVFNLGMQPSDPKNIVNSVTEDKLHKVDVTIQPAPGITITGCEGEQELIQGKSVKLTCDVTVNEIPSTKKGLTSTILIDYGYYIDSEPIKLTALGK
ncbi:MAG: hypothetical protein QXY29_03465 [Candidatus Aenigmatarchaeota archaeon]